MSNYGTVTTPQLEWWFVVEPTSERLCALGRSDWPADTKLREDPEMRHRCRQPKPLTSYASQCAEINGRLREVRPFEGDDFEDAYLLEAVRLSLTRALALTLLARGGARPRGQPPLLS